MLATPIPLSTAAAPGLGLPPGAPVAEGMGFGDLLLRVVAELAEAPGAAAPALAMGAAAPAIAATLAPALEWTATAPEAGPVPDSAWRTPAPAGVPEARRSEPTPLEAPAVPAEAPVVPLTEPQPFVNAPLRMAFSLAGDIEAPPAGGTTAPPSVAAAPARHEADTVPGPDLIRPPPTIGDSPPALTPVTAPAVATLGLSTMLDPPPLARAARSGAETPPTILLALPVGVVPRTAPARGPEPATLFTEAATDAPAGADPAMAAVASAGPPAPRPLNATLAYGPPPDPVAGNAVVGREPLPALPQAAPLAEAVHIPAPSPLRQILPITIAMLISPGTAPTLTVTLEPGEMGQLEIRIGRDTEGTTLRLIAERPETTALLQRDQRELQHGLAQSGIRLDAGAIQFETSGGGGQSHDRPPPRHRQARDAPPIHEPDVPASLLDLRI